MNVANTDPIAFLIARLEAESFGVERRREGHVDLAKSENEVVLSRIHISRQRNGKGLGIQLKLSYRRPEFASDPGDEDPYSDAIEINVTPDGLKYDGETFALSWLNEQLADAWGELQEQGLPWLRRHGKVDGLIDLLESGLRDGIPCSGPTGLRHSFLSRLLHKGLPQAQVRRPPGFYHALACLYFHKGDDVNALKWMKAWIEFRGANLRNVKGFVIAVTEIEARMRRSA